MERIATVTIERRMGHGFWSVYEYRAVWRERREIRRNGVLEPAERILSRPWRVMRMEAEWDAASPPHIW